MMNRDFFARILILYLIIVSSGFFLLTFTFVQAASDVKLDFFIWGGGKNDEGKAITLDSVGNAYITGYTSSFGVGGKDICLVKFNNETGVEWNTTWGGINDDVGWDIALDSSGNIYVTGYTSSFGASVRDICLIKFNSTGSVEWNTTWSGSNDDVGKGIFLDLSGNIYVSGYTSSFGAGQSDVCLVKFNSTGGVEWYTTWGGIDNDYGEDIVLDLSGNAFVTGYTYSFGVGHSDVCLVKFNSTGGIEWNSTWGDSYIDFGRSVILDSSGNIYISGDSEFVKWGASIGHYVLLAKFNSTGDMEWYQRWKKDFTNYGRDSVMDCSGNIFIVGDSNVDSSNDYDLNLVQFNSTGDVEWYCSWGDSNDQIGYGASMDSSGNIYITGYTGDYIIGTDMFLVKFIPGQCPVPSPSLSGLQLPGYDLFLVFGIMLSILVFLIKKNKGQIIR